MDDAFAGLEGRWDVAVVGSGMGGATLAFELASRGFRVVLLERGARVAATPGVPEASDPAGRFAQGWWPEQSALQHPDTPQRRFHAPLGCAVGGSSVHYAAALERMAPSDFEALQGSGGSVPAWPVPFGEFSGYYRKAEQYYGIADRDPQRAEARLSEWDRAFLENLRGNGLAPEVLRVAIRYDEQCEECIGRICPRQCKADARTACVEKAAALPGFRLVELCEVLRLDADGERVQAAIARVGDREIRIEARMFVLAAGALHTPQLLLRSASEHWPEGLANRSGQVGRNLMFHTVEIYALWSPRRLSREGRQRKALSIRDFYVRDERRLGYIQSMGFGAERGVIAAYLKNALRRRGLRSDLLLRLAVALPARIAERLLGAAVIFAAMTEDDPDPDNRVRLDPQQPDGSLIEYRITDDLRARADALRDAFAAHVAPWRMVRASTALKMNYGHPCGTTRFGTDPRTSVLDPHCKAHDVDNLYVADASFMPRSGAVNPSLTIAANALRVADAIATRLTGA